MISFYNLTICLELGLAVLVFFLLFFISAPYGKFLRKGWGPSVRAKWAWMIMESPSPVLMVLCFASSSDPGPVKYVFLAIWLLHYIHRTLIYPFTQSGSNKAYPLLLVAMAVFFNFVNGFVNGYGVFHLMNYDINWLFSWQFVSGLLVFVSGFIINKTADEKLRKLRDKNRDEYVLPQGWLFNYISCPHYFGEIIEWGGWALMTWSLPGLTFFIFTFANLFPRAVSSHKWYKKRFPNYPESRKAVIPFIV